MPTPIRYDLRGKVVLITGGAQGIGLGLARAVRARGAQVALVDIDGARAGAEASRLGPDAAVGLGADVTSRTAMENVVRTVVRRFGGLDVVVANAGIAPHAATVRAMDPAVFERVVEVDLLGVYRTVHAALPQIVARRGHVVLTSSIYAFMNGILVSPYAVSKAGVEQLGRALRAELRPHGASATVAYFGFVDTAMVQKGFDEDPLARRSLEDLIPRAVQRRITPAEAGEAVARGVERRRPRVIAPRYWAVMSALRGIAGPLLDGAIDRLPRAQALLRDADVAGRLPAATGAATTGPRATGSVTSP